MNLMYALTWCFSSLVLSTFVVTGAHRNAYDGVNLALNKPSFQTSTYIAHANGAEGPNSPNLANDGSRISHHRKFCAVSNQHRHPWWAVDLGGYYTIDHVIFTNRGDSCSHCVSWSNNFVIGLTNISPKVNPPKLKQYAMCGQYPGKVGKGATVTLHCKPGLPAFRYVVVQFLITNHLNFCELEVYGRPGCPSGFTPNYHVGGCYKLVSDKLQWEVAGLRCNALNKDAHLVVVNSFAEQTAIAHMLASEKGKCEMYWTAGQRFNPDNQKSAFVWKVKQQDRSPSVKMSEMTYSNWKHGYPKYAGSRAVCAAMDRRSYFAWEDRWCLNEYCFICEMDMHA